VNVGDGGGAGTRLRCGRRRRRSHRRGRRGSPPSSPDGWGWRSPGGGRPGGYRARRKRQTAGRPGPPGLWSGSSGRPKERSGESRVGGRPPAWGPRGRRQTRETGLGRGRWNHAGGPGRSVSGPGGLTTQQGRDGHQWPEEQDRAEEPHPEGRHRSRRSAVGAGRQRLPRP
jgi:hypothetical protein